MNKNIEEVLVSLRRIIRATDMHSKKLLRASGLTAPQLMILQCLQERSVTSPGQIAKDVGLTQATVTTILDRLEKRMLITRHRSEQDKRRVFVELTPSGHKTVLQAPTPLQDSFVEKFDRLEEWEQTYITSALQRVASMMNADHIDASPLLDIGAVDRQSEVIPVNNDEDKK